MNKEISKNDGEQEILLEGLENSIVCLGSDLKLHRYSPVKVQGHLGEQILKCSDVLQIKVNLS